MAARGGVDTSAPKTFKILIAPGDYNAFRSALGKSSPQAGFDAALDFDGSAR